MTINLPEPVAAYFTADKSDGESVSECFTEGAIVKDEGAPITAVRRSRSGRRKSRPNTSTRANP